LNGMGIYSFQTWVELSSLSEHSREGVNRVNVSLLTARKELGYNGKIVAQSWRGTRSYGDFAGECKAQKPGFRWGQRIITCDPLDSSSLRESCTILFMTKNEDTASWDAHLVSRHQYSIDSDTLRTSTHDSTKL
jgi:hypothetical protein